MMVHDDAATTSIPHHACRHLRLGDIELVLRWKYGSIIVNDKGEHHVEMYSG